MTVYVKEHISNKPVTSLEELPVDEKIIICTPAYEASKIFALHPELSKLLSEISYVPLITVTLFYEAGSFSKLKKGFGCLIPEEEDFTSMGILFNHDIFAERVKEPAVSSLTFILKPAKLPVDIESTDLDIVNACRGDADKLFREKKTPLSHSITRWEKALPLYSPRHLEIIKNLDSLLKQSLPGIALFGNYTGQISLRGMLRTAGQIFNN
jgi:protoporphyrinogen oxidase